MRDWGLLMIGTAAGTLLGFGATNPNAALLVFALGILFIGSLMLVTDHQERSMPAIEVVFEDDGQTQTGQTIILEDGGMESTLYLRVKNRRGKPLQNVVVNVVAAEALDGGTLPHGLGRWRLPTELRWKNGGRRSDLPGLDEPGHPVHVAVLRRVFDPENPKFYVCGNGALWDDAITHSRLVRIDLCASGWDDAGAVPTCECSFVLDLGKHRTTVRPYSKEAEQ